MSSTAIARSSEQLLARHILLRDHPGRADHGEPSVVQLPGLHHGQLARVSRLKSKRIKAEVTGDVRLLDAPRLETLGRAVEREHREDLRDRDRKHDGGPEGLQRRLLEGGEGRRFISTLSIHCKLLHGSGITLFRIVLDNLPRLDHTDCRKAFHTKFGSNEVSVLVTTVLDDLKPIKFGR